MRFTCLGTDVGPWLVQRAETGQYGRSSVKDLPEDLLHAGLEPQDGSWIVRDVCRQDVEFAVHNVREAPPGLFDVVLCRNLVCTYFDEPLQREVLQGISKAIQPRGALVLGMHEGLPQGIEGFAPWGEQRAIYRRVD